MLSTPRISCWELRAS